MNKRHKEENAEIVRCLDQAVEEEVLSDLQLKKFDCMQDIRELLILAFEVIRERELERVVEEEDLVCCAVHELLETRGGDILRDAW